VWRRSKSHSKTPNYSFDHQIMQSEKWKWDREGRRRCINDRDMEVKEVMSGHPNCFIFDETHGVKVSRRGPRHLPNQ
jgi:YD repeat-containing protein